MTPKQMADRLVELRIVHRDAQDQNLYWPPSPAAYPVPASHLKSDWRVAGAVIDALPNHVLHLSAYEDGAVAEFILYSPNGDEEADPVFYRGFAPGNQNATAIIEAGLEALNE